MSEITPETLALLRRLHGEATPGPWTTDRRCLDQAVLARRGRLVADCCIIGNPLSPDAELSANGRLIAAMRNALPALLDVALERDRLRAEVLRLRALAWEAAEASFTAQDLADFRRGLEEERA